MKKTLLSLFIAFFCTMLLTPSFANEGPNLIQNNYFGGGLAEWNWWGKEPSAQFDRINGFYALITGRAALNQVVEVTPNTTYKLTVNMFLKPGSQLNIGVKNPSTEENEQYLKVYNENEWVRTAELTVTSDSTGTLKIYLFVPKDGDQAHITYVNFRTVTETGNPRLIETTPEATVPDFALSTVNTYPNPFTEVLHVSFTKNYEIAELLNLSGKIISTQDITGINEMTLSPKIKSGVYLLRLSGKNGSDIKQVIKK